MEEAVTPKNRRVISAAYTTLSSSLGKHWVRVVLLALIGFAVRMPALQGLPIWDDHWLIKDNPFIKSPLLMAEAFRHYLFLDGFSTHYRPFQNVSFAFDYLMWNGDPYGYHLTNLLLHLASGILLYSLLHKLFAQLWLTRADETAAPSTASGIPSTAAFVVALLWIVHPVHSAAIDYISGRADSLAFVLSCGAWLLCLRARVQATCNSRIAHYVAAAFCGMLGLCSREITFVWFCLFLLHLFAFEKQASRKAKLIAVGSCLLLVGSYAVLRNLPTHQVAVSAQHGTPGPQRAVLMLRALGDYAQLMVFPTKLCMERTVLNYRNYRSTSSWHESVGTEYLSILGVLLLAALAYGAARKGAGQRLRVFGAVWFLFGYLPISNLVELNANVAEHWLYLPSVGFLIFLTGVVLDLPLVGRKVSLAVACLALCGFSARAYVRSSDWITPKTFFQRTMASGGASTRAAVNLALIYANEGDNAHAEVLFRRVLEIAPDYPTARNGLASVLYRQGKKAEGEATFAVTKDAAAETRKEYPSTWAAALNLARLRHQEKDDVAALALLEKARRDYPQTWEIISFQSELLRQTEGPASALRPVADFARDNWWHQAATLALGRLLAEKGDVEEALNELRFASWLDVHDAEALNLVALLCLRQDRLEEARSAQARAVSRQPDEPRQYRLLAEILSKMGRDAEAKKAMAKIASLEALAQNQVALN